MPLADITTFASLTQVKLFIPESTTDNDPLLKQLLDMTTRIIQDYLGYKVFQATYTEYHNGDGKSDKLLVNQPPIISVTSLYDDPNRSYGADSLLTENTDFIIVDKTDENNPGTIQLLDGIFFLKGLNNIKITYVGGFSTANIPYAIKQAQIDFVAYLFEHRAQRTGILSLKIGSYSITYKDDNSRLGHPSSVFEIPGSIRASLDAYRLPRLQSTGD